mmetsp:Transcript_12506/g.18722  ORF Transcript_12506/g.18722 Transcript_12506/m.18722 type:complete len:293 (-) Transcript_12506:57-935(-)
MSTSFDQQSQVGYVNNLTSRMQKQLNTLKSRLKDPSNSYHKDVYLKLRSDQQDSDAFYLRFLRARNFSKKKAMKMLVNFVAKYDDLDLYNKTIDDVPSVINTHAVQFLGPDKYQRQIILITPGKHTPGSMDYREVEAAFLMAANIAELTLDTPESKNEHITLMFHYKDWGLSNVDTKVDRIFMKVGQDCMPERLGKSYFVQPPKVFQGVWTFCKPFLDEKTKNKFIFIDKLDELKDDIDDYVLPKVLGGSREHTPTLYEYLKAALGKGTLGEYVERFHQDRQNEEDDDMDLD